MGYRLKDFQKPRSLDIVNNVVLFFNHPENNRYKFDLLRLELDSMKSALLGTIITSGDPMSGCPWISNIDYLNRNVTYSFVNNLDTLEKIKFNY